MNCIKCNSSNTHVVNTREYAEGKSCKRTLKCKSCDHRFHTYEIAQENEKQIFALEKNGTHFPLSKVHHNIDVDLIDTAIENLLQLKESI